MHLKKILNFAKVVSVVILTTLFCERIEYKNTEIQVVKNTSYIFDNVCPKYGNCNMKIAMYTQVKGHLDESFDNIHEKRKR